MSTCAASIIIPTYNRFDSLRLALDSLATQDIGTNSFEVIVVDDGSDDDTRSTAYLDQPFALRYVQQENQGSARARNTGASLAASQLLIFLDDDMRLEPYYVSSLVEVHQRHSSVVGMGIEMPCLPINPSRFSKIVTEDRHQGAVGESDGTWVDFTQCVTNNLSVLQGDFESAGKMQDLAGDGPTWWGDVDFGYRAKRQGLRFYRSHEAICYHCDYSIRDLGTAAQRAEKTAEMVQFLVARYPDILDHLPMFEDKQPINWANDESRLALRKLARRAVSTEVGLSGLEAITRVAERLSPSDALLRPLYRWVLGGHIYRGYQRGVAKWNATGAIDVES